MIERLHNMKNFELSMISRRDFDQQVNKLLSENPSQHLFVNITKKKKKRSISANSQQHVFYTQISEQLGDTTPLEVKNMCKDMFGIPILLRSDEHQPKISFLLDKLKYYSYSYENRLKLVQCFSVTSEFNRKQSKEYMDHMIMYYGNQNVIINYQD